MAYKIGWFSTGRDKAARDLLTTIHSGIKEGAIKAQIIFVFSDRGEGEAEESDKFFELVKSFGIPLICFSSKKFEPDLRGKSKGDPIVLKQWRDRYHWEVTKLLGGYDPDLIVLAGYMLIVSGEMCRKYPMINLHPAAPGGPTGTWREVIWKLIEARQSRTGIMIHLVTEELDKGPPITYCAFPIRGASFDELWKNLDEKLEIKTLPQIIREEGEENPLFKEIRKNQVIRELPLIFHTIQRFAEGRINISRGSEGEVRSVIVDGKVLTEGFNLSREINAHLKEWSTGELN
ncbi:MAG: formyltransferase family protein [Actinomycetota bacterium]|nr:formyltransferase family protein [Actinomycetota bacterium]